MKRHVCLKAKECNQCVCSVQGISIHNLSCGSKWLGCIERSGVGGGGSERRYDKELWEKRGSTSQMHIALLSTQPPSLPPHHRPLYFCPLHIPPIASQYSCQFAAPGEDKDGNPHSSVLLWKTETEERCTTERIRKKQVSCNWKRRKASTTWPQMCKFRKRQLHKSKERMTQT